MKKLFLFCGLLLVLIGPVSSLADEPPIKVDFADPTVEATDAGGADAMYHVKAYDDGVPIAATCDVPAGTVGAGDFDSPVAHYPLGNTTVTCEGVATSGPVSGSATVTVEDTTAPAFGTTSDVEESTTDPSGKDVSYSIPSATDAVSGSIQGDCNPASGSHFVVGSTQVNCSATDGSGNTGHTSFQVHVTLDDTQAPTLNVPGDQTVEASGPSGAAVTYTVTATDNSGQPPTINCSHASGSVFPLGTTGVSCTATDGAGNATSGSFNVTVQDSTAPVLSIPGNQQVETENPSGATVAYSASATDTVAGAVSPGCSPASGSLFPVGTTQVNCTANDGRGNSASGSFNVTVVLVDHTAPTFTGVPSPIRREADGPLGSAATYTPPTATDNLDVGPLLVTCLPTSGSTFPLGTTNVNCTATDSHGNVGLASFAVTVVDTTKPVLTPPGDRNVYATTPSGIPREDPAVTPFLHGGTATDIVDKTLFIGNNAPEFFPVGATVVTFGTADDSGNTAAGTATLTVFPMPPAGTAPPALPQPPNRTPPDDVRNLKAQAGSGRVTLTWTRPTAADFDHVTVTRSLADGSSPTLVYSGKGTSYVDRSVQNGVEYRYTVVAFDQDGNRSAGVVVAAVPKVSLLRTPRDGARVKITKTSPRLSWARVGEADYYNVQLYVVPGLKAAALGPLRTDADVKVRSIWPTKTSFLLKKTWKFGGKRYRLRPGVLYRWYVWPGFGNRRAADYGPLMGSSTFQVVR